MWSRRSRSSGAVIVTVRIGWCYPPNNRSMNGIGRFLGILFFSRPWISAWAGGVSARAEFGEIKAGMENSFAPKWSDPNVSL